MNSAKIMAIVGSLRKDSVNRMIAEAAMASAGDGVGFNIVDLGDVPVYNGDLEAAGVPDSVSDLHEQMAAADGLLIFSPEYNGSFPAVTKNAIDWLSRPPQSWEGKAIAMVVASPGPRGGVSVRTHFETIMEYLPVRLFESMGIGMYGDKIADGELVDPVTRTELADYVRRFGEFAIEK